MCCLVHVCCLVHAAERDVVELCSGARVGGSYHHIQGLRAVSGHVVHDSFEKKKGKKKKKQTNKRRRYNAACVCEKPMEVVCVCVMGITQLTHVQGTTFYPGTTTFLIKTCAFDFLVLHRQRRASWSSSAPRTSPICSTAMPHSCTTRSTFPRCGWQPNVRGGIFF